MLVMDSMMDHNDLCANQLLDFVSNASKEVQDMLGKVDEDIDKPEQTRKACISLPIQHFSSPVPSPTPSVVSSISDQEVPTMSPKSFQKKSQRRRRKRDFDTISEASMVEYPSKVRRADSLGDNEEYLDFAFNSNTYITPMGHYQQQQETYKQSSCRYSSTNNQYPTYPSKLQPRVQYQQETYDNHHQYFPNQLDWPVQNTDFQNTYTLQQQEHVPDIADLVSWMVAENFLDNESLSFLLTQC